jgi:hypothetical protein
MTSESGATVYEPAVDNTDTGQDGLTEGRRQAFWRHRQGAREDDDDTALGYDC